jgi:biotin transport system permease protein
VIAALHVPGTSVLHRLGPGIKLLALSGLGIGLFFVANPWILCACAVLALVAYPACGLGWRRAGAQLRALAVFLILIGATQAWIAGWTSAVEVCARLVTLVLAASLVTYTTALSALMETLERGLRPLAPLGARPQALAFTLTLTIRFIPVLMGLAKETRDAMAARGRERAWFAIAVPLIIRSLRLADQVSEAVEARGLDQVIEARADGGLDG